MLLIRDLLPKFPKVQPTIFVNVLGVRAFNVCFMHKDKSSADPRPVERELFGAVVNPAYEAPMNNAWQEGESTAIVAASASIQVPEIADPEVKRLEGVQEQDPGPSEDSSKGLKLLMNVALKGKRKASDMDDDQSLARSGRRTRSASRHLLIDNVAQDNPKLETEPNVETEPPQEARQVPITSQAEPTVASVCLDSHPTTEPFQSHVTPSTASASTTPSIDDTRFSKLESRVRKLKKLSKKLSSQLAFITDSAVEQNKAYSLLLQVNNNLLDKFAIEQKQVKKLKHKVRRLQKDKPAQGGVVRQSSDDQVKRASDDSENDVIFMGESELVGPSNTGQQTTLEGESSGRRTRRKRN